MQPAREFNLSDGDFGRICRLVNEHTGISLSEAKRDLVYGRLVKRLRTLGLGSFAQYCQLVVQDDGDELEHFANAITTNLTSFFREAHHFEFLARVVLPELRRQHARGRRIRLWSAGCSSGEEVYSMAMVLREAMPDLAEWDVKILATDIDSSVLDRARRGSYARERLDGVSPERIKRWFETDPDGVSGVLRVVPRLRELVTFKQLNLMDAWPMRGPFEVIFCRNVVIYFDKPTQRGLFDRYAGIMRTGGCLFIGHSESLFQVTDRFKLLGRTVYQKLG